MLCVLWGVYHTLMWNRILYHGRGGLLHVLLWCLLRGGWCWRVGKTTRVFQPFEIIDLGEMMSVMAKITTKGTMEVGFNIIFISPLTPIIIAPPRGFDSLGAGCPQWVGSAGVDSRLDLGYCFSCFVLYF
jgi:hypothetical protein